MRRPIRDASQTDRCDVSNFVQLASKEQIKSMKFESFRVLVGLLLTGVSVAGEITGVQGEARAEQQVRAEPKLVRPDDVEHLFEVPKPMSFDEYVEKFGKQYAAKSERLMRETIYTANHANALRSQVAYLLGAQDYFMGPTPFSDRTIDELTKILPIRMQSQSEAGDQSVESEPLPAADSVPFGDSFKAHNKVAGANLPLRASQTVTLAGREGRSDVIEPKDLRTATNCIGPVKDQQNCGACYAFATIAALEYLYCRENDQHVSLSEQYIIDCGRAVRMSGCQSGHVHRAIQFAHEWGIFREREYPYANRENRCAHPNGKSTSPLYLTDDRYIPVHKFYWASFLQQGVPLIVKVFMNFRIYAGYRGGVLRPHRTNDEITHSMLLVGIGTSPSTYLILRNSHGSNWGVAGYLHMDINSPCLEPVANVPSVMRPGYQWRGIYSRHLYQVGGGGPNRAPPAGA
jgi:hypothetical protein